MTKILNINKECITNIFKEGTHNAYEVLKGIPEDSKIIDIKIHNDCFELTIQSEQFIDEKSYILIETMPYSNEINLDISKN